MTSYGIAIAGDKPMKEGDWIYDSRKKKATVDLKPDMQHARILEMNGGTVWTRAAGAGAISWKETLEFFPHHMPFKPVVLGYFYVTDMPTDRITGLEIGTFSKGRAWMVSNAVGYGSESIWIEADETNIYVYHQASASGAGVAFNGVGNTASFRLRYLVLNLEDLTHDRSMLEVV